MRSCGGQSGERHVLRGGIYNNPAQRTRFEHARSALEAKGAPTKEIWVWHGSRSNGSISAIMSDGFKVGSKDAGIPVAHGMVHGPGVYTSRTVPFGYTTTTQKSFSHALFLVTTVWSTAVTRARIAGCQRAVKSGLYLETAGSCCCPFT